MSTAQGSVNRCDTPRIWTPALKEGGVAFLAAGVLLSIFYGFAFRWIHPEFVPFMDREAKILIASGKDFVPISVGRHRVEGESIVIEDFNVDEAILALPRAFQAEDYPFIKVNLEGFTRYSKFKILWRRAEDPSHTHSLEFNRSGDQATQIAMVYAGENYQGQIADIALLFYDGPEKGVENNNDVDIAIRSIQFRPFSALGVAEQIWEDWTNAPLWSGRSNNLVLGAHQNAIILPNPVAIALLLVGCSLLLAQYHFVTQSPRSKARDSRGVIRSLAVLCLYIWIAQDFFRLHWRVAQYQDTQDRYFGRSKHDAIYYSDIRCARFPTDCKDKLSPHF